MSARKVNGGTFAYRLWMVVLVAWLLLGLTLLVLGLANGAPPQPPTVML